MNTALPITARFAFRSLWRNSRRSALSIIGIAIGCSVALTNISLAKGKIDLFIRNIAEGGTGHFRVVPQGWSVSHDPSLRLKNWKQELFEARAISGVRVATPRARLQGMLAMGTHMVGVEIVGVDPQTEPGAFRYVRTMKTGRYLRAEDSHSMILGQALAERLRVEIGDSIVVTAVDRKGTIKSDMFELIGTVALGSKPLESSICQVTLSDLESLSGFPGAGEIAVILEKPESMVLAMNQMRAHIAPGDVVLSWEDIRPDSRLAIQINSVTATVLTVILIFVAFVGVASAQLTAILERRKEFAVLSAIGVGAKRIVGLIVSEAAILGTLSWFATMILCGPLLYHFAKVGIRVLSKNQSMNVVGTVIDPIFHPDFGSWFFFYAAFLTYFSTLAASIYPSIFTVKLNPAEALRVAE